MAEQHELFTAADGSYWMQACVLARSLTRTHRGRARLTVFGNGWAKRSIELLKAQGSELVEIRHREVNDAQFSAIRLSHGFPIATAYNILAADFLLAELDRVTYLDADMLVLADISELGRIEFDQPVAAVMDAHVTRIGNPSMWRPWREMGVRPDLYYLNTGVMVQNLAAWRRERIAEQTIALLTKYQMPCVDQDALNLVLQGNFKRLAPRFNSMPYHLLKMFRNADVDEAPEEIDEAVSDPAILHFHRSFLGKPWVYGSRHPGKDVWLEVAKEIDQKFRRRLALYEWIRNTAAGFAGMAQTDPRSVSQANFRTGIQNQGPPLG